MATTRNAPATLDTVSFTCNFCVRPEESRGLPTADENGEKLPEQDIVDHYNERRYAHYFRDFDNAPDLKKHLDDRTRYWMQGAQQVDLETALKGHTSTVQWFINAKKARR